MIPIYNFLFLILLISSLLVSFSNSQGLPIPTETPTDAPVLADGDTLTPTRSPASFLVGATQDPATTPLPTESATEAPTVPVLNVAIDSSLQAGNNQWQSSYAVHSNFMLDQERGTYTMQTYYTSKWSSISASQIASWKSKYYNTLVLLLITLDNYKSSDISASSLSQIHNEFQIYRSAGIKTLIRIIYSDEMGSKPWGDATSASVVFRHIDQLTPIFRINEDVIAYIQGGFVGLWGEWYYTDSFGDESTQSAQNIADRKTVISKLMAAFPNRAVQVRTPYWMKKFYGNTPLAAANYATELGRAGHHNDCYLADSSDMGTYNNYASEYAYLSQQTKFTPAIFETCATGNSRSLCPTALKETAGLHMVSGHRLYNTAVWNQWISGGCYDTIVKNLGHRLEFVSSTVDIQTNIGSTFNVNVNVRNTGYASPSNARKTEVILRSVDGSSYCVATLNYDVRTLQSGTTANINSFVRLPNTIAAGRYEVLMQFADPYTTLYGVPWYKIQAANTNIYEAGTGFHKLNAVLDVLSPLSTGATQAGEVTAKCGLSLSSLINSTVTSADSSCLTGYYKVNGICTYCPPGQACASATSTPSTCAAGTYSVGGQNSCLQCPSTCSNHGTCSTKTGACVCNSGFQGYDCSLISGSTFAPTKAPTTTPTTSKATTAIPTTSKPTITPTTTKPTVIPTTTKPVITTTSSPSTVKPTTNIVVNPTTKSAPTQTQAPTIANCPPSTPSLLTNECMLSLWRKAGCTTTVIPDTAITIAYWKGLSTIAAVTADMTEWATTNDAKHITGCYATTNAPSTSTPGPTGTGCPKQVNLLMNSAFGSVKNADGTETATSWTAIGTGYDVTIRKGQPTLKLTSVNVNRIIGAYQSITLSTPTKQAISFGAYISTAYVTGSIDYKFSLQLTLTYTDGTTENKSIYLATGSYGWKWKSMTFTPSIAVSKIDYKFTMVGHTGYAYITQPVVGIVQQCALPLVTSGDSPLLSNFDSPIAFEGTMVLADTGSDADSAAQETSTSALSTTVIIIIASCVGAVVLIGIIVGMVLYRKRRAQKLDTAITNQLTSV